MRYQIPRLEDYEPHIGGQAVERILTKAARLSGFHVTHINSTYYGGGVAELLSSLTLLLNGLGIRAGWRVLQGSPDFFGITKRMHNALQGKPFEFTPLKRRIYESAVHQNSLRNHLDRDMMVNLVPHHVQSGWVSLALDKLGIEPDASYQVHDVQTVARYLWHGAQLRRVESILLSRTRLPCAPTHPIRTGL